MCGCLFGLAGEAVRPDRLGVERLRLLDRHDGIERLVVNEDSLDGVRGRRFVLGEHERDRVAHEDRPLPCQKQGRPVPRRQRGQVGGGDHGCDPRHRLGGGGVDAYHLGVSVRTRDQASVEKSGPVEVAAVAERTLDLGAALEEFGGSADRCHVESPTDRAPIVVARGKESELRGAIVRNQGPRGRGGRDPKEKSPEGGCASGLVADEMAWDCFPEEVVLHRGVFLGSRHLHQAVTAVLHWTTSFPGSSTMRRVPPRPVAGSPRLTPGPPPTPRGEGGTTTRG